MSSTPPNSLGDHPSEPVPSDNLTAESDADRRRKALNLNTEIEDYLLSAAERMDQHDPRARLWDAIANGTSWAAAAGAALATVTIITQNITVAGVIAIITLLFTTFVAVFKPAERAASHRSVWANYHDVQFGLQSLRRELSELTTQYVEETGYDPETGEYDAGYYISKPFQSKLLAGLEDRFNEIQKKYQETVKAPPYVKVAKRV